MSKYDVNFTQVNKDAIEVPEAGMNNDFDVSFPGRVRLEWGEEINESFLNLMENFACPGIVDSNGRYKPDTSQSSLRDVTDLATNKLADDSVVKGQLWYNKTDERLYHYNGVFWEPYTLSENDYAANWGQVAHGQQLPRPVSNPGQPNEYVFDYDECIWSVSPFQYVTRFDRMDCFSNPATSEVTMQYRIAWSGAFLNGTVNYMIIGIRNNINNISDSPCV